MNQGHIRKRGKASWEIKWDAGIDPMTNKRRTRYQSVKGTKGDARAELNKRLGEVATGTAVNPDNKTVAGLADEWLANVAPSKASPKTLERWQELSRCHIKPCIGHIKVKDLISDHVEAFYRDREDNGRCDGTGGLSPRTVHHIHRLLSRMLDSAVLKRKITSNPAKEAQNKPKPGDAEIVILDEQERGILLEAAKDTRFHAPVLLALTTGMRRGEILGLQWQDVDLDNATLTVRQSLEETKQGLRLKTPKTTKGRRKIALAQVTVGTLRDHRLGQMQERLSLGLGGRAETVFTHYTGGLIRPRNFTKEFTRLVRAAGLQVTFHGLRHTHATQLLSKGVNVKVVSERLGHADISITLRTYGHTMPDMQETAVQQIEAAFAGV